MNRYPLWKNLTILIIVVLGLLYALPTYFGESPAIQISSAKSSIKLSNEVLDQVTKALAEANITAEQIYFEDQGKTTSIKARFKDTDVQGKAKDTVQKILNPDANDPHYIVALNLLSKSPSWLTKIHAYPMYLGLDLRGGVHFLMQVDMKAAVSKRLDSLTGDARTLLRYKNIRHAGINKEGEGLNIRFKEASDRSNAKSLLTENLSELTWVEAAGSDNDLLLNASLSEASRKKIQDYALKQNINTLHNRINELGVAEPIIQQQGVDRVVVQLPGVQDTAKAKDILGRTATLEIRMVDETPPTDSAAPFGTDKYSDRDGGAILVKKQVLLTGENLTDAQAGFDPQTNEAAVHLTLDAKGARIFRDVTRENINKRMAILLIEKNKGEVVTAPVIRGEIGGGRVQISGRMTSLEATDTALLLRAGSLAAPMEIIEERTIGPSLGADNIKKGFNATLYGFAAIAIFMIIYYMMFGVFSVIALAVNLLLLLALLSLLQATLTLPGIAAIALALGMAIDSNVLINERIREELRAGASPHQAILHGYDRAFDTILDSNITTLIAGIALLIFGSGAVRGFAVVHCLGILTSIFSATLVSRALVNLWYGSKKKLTSLAIG